MAVASLYLPIHQIVMSRKKRTFNWEEKNDWHRQNYTNNNRVKIFGHNNLKKNSHYIISLDNCMI